LATTGSSSGYVGLTMSEGELIVFTDDDCYVEESYLSTLHAKFDRNAPGAIKLWGGRITRSSNDHHSVLATTGSSSGWTMDPGFAHAQNVGLTMSEGELIVFTDDDCYVEESYLIKLWGGRITRSSNDHHSVLATTGSSSGWTMPISPQLMPRTSGSR
jgi:cellulose synthase/poly-beta-1,6-N-acetylglucosamine synthase-like glycosyltransferase